MLSDTNNVSKNLKNEASQLSNGMHEFNKELMKIKMMKDEYDKEMIKSGIKIDKLVDN